MDILYYMAYNNNSINRSSATSVALKRQPKKFKSDTGQSRKKLIFYQYKKFGLKKLREAGYSDTHAKRLSASIRHGIYL